MFSSSVNFIRQSLLSIHTAGLALKYMCAHVDEQSYHSHETMAPYRGSQIFFKREATNLDMKDTTIFFVVSSPNKGNVWAAADG